MRLRLKMIAADPAEADAPDAQVLHGEAGAPARWPEHDPRATTDWCCAGCGRVLLIGFGPRFAGLLVECGECRALSRVPGTRH